jgi:NAD(P)H-nitrite reductase large subunit
MFSEILEDGVRWSDGTVLRADVILWCTGFRSSLDHLLSCCANPAAA